MPKVVRKLADGIVTLRDNVAEMLELILEEGDLAWDYTHNIVNVLDRGTLSHMREGDQVPVTFTFTLKYVELVHPVGEVAPTPYECFTRTGNAAAWVSTNPDGGDVYTIDIQFDLKNPSPVGQDERLLFARAAHTSIAFKEGGDYDTLVVSGQAFITRPAATRGHMTTTTTTTEGPEPLPSTTTTTTTSTTTTTTTTAA